MYSLSLLGWEESNLFNATKTARELKSSLVTLAYNNPDKYEEFLIYSNLAPNGFFRNKSDQDVVGRSFGSYSLYKKSIEKQTELDTRDIHNLSLTNAESRRLKESTRIVFILDYAKKDSDKYFSTTIDALRLVKKEIGSKKIVVGVKNAPENKKERDLFLSLINPDLREDQILAPTRINLYYVLLDFLSQEIKFVNEHPDQVEKIYREFLSFTELKSAMKDTKMEFPDVNEEKELEKKETLEERIESVSNALKPLAEEINELQKEYSQLSDNKELQSQEGRVGSI